MKGDRLIKVNSKEFHFFIEALYMAFPECIDETIEYFCGYGSENHLYWLYVLTDDCLYMFDASNGLNMRTNMFFRIPVGLIKSVGMIECGLNTVSYVVLYSGEIIPLKVYSEIELLSEYLDDINKIINSKILKPTKTLQLETTEMILLKGIIKRTEFEDNALSPYEFKSNQNGLAEYLKKRKRLVKKLENIIPVYGSSTQHKAQLLNIGIKEIL